MDEELKHYGVIGMKWGVHRARSKSESNDRLRRKALDYEKKQAEYTKKSEKAHAKYDLEGANRKAVKSAKYKMKAAKLEKKALKSSSELKRSMYERKAANLKYKSAKSQMDADRISKSKGYGAKAMKYFFDRIFNDFGSAGLKNAIKATKLHINYRKECGIPVDTIEEICESYERRL